MAKIACEQPDDHDRSLCQWDCAEIARTLVAEGLVDGLSGETVRRLLSHHKLKPWRHHLWLWAKLTRRCPGARMAPTLSNWACRQTRAENSGAKGRKRVIISAGRVIIGNLFSQEWLP